MVYAKGTSVSVEKSRAEIETTLERYGATAFGYMRDEKRAAIECIAHDRRIRFVLPLPGRDEKRFTHKKNRSGFLVRRSDSETYIAWEQGCRERWRSLALAVKAKLEAVASGISSFEYEFLANIVDPLSNKTVGDLVTPQIEHNYNSNGGEHRMLQLPSPPSDAQ